MRDQSTLWRRLFLTVYLIFTILPLYWMVNMSFKTNTEILGSFSLWPHEFTVAHYQTIFTDPAWYYGYINSLIYVLINTVISLIVALPAAYAFSRYRFIGDKHVFFLAAYKPYDAAGGVSVALLSVLQLNRLNGHAFGCSLGASRV